MNNQIKKKALITGITGQDGSYLAEFLLNQGYEVHGVVRRVAIEESTKRLGRIAHLLDKVILHPASLENYGSIYQIIDKVRPDEVYHLGALSFVTYSFDDAFSTFDINIFGTLNILQAIRILIPKCKFYFAGSSEMFGETPFSPQNETAPFYPRSPYGISKVASFDITRNFRDGYDIFACSGILFNHESPRRGFEFVTRKISDGAARIKLGLAKELRLGNLEAKRDWGYAEEYVKAMWQMLQQDKPDDFVIATGETHSVKEFAELAFKILGLNWQDYMTEDKDFYRPAEVNELRGDYSKAKKILGWEPKVKFEQLVEMMVKTDYDLLKNKNS